MLNVLTVAPHGRFINYRQSSAVPRVGDHVDLFYNPRPRVENVIWWPDASTIEVFTTKNVEVDVIVVVK